MPYRRQSARVLAERQRVRDAERRNVVQFSRLAMQFESDVSQLNFGTCSSCLRQVWTKHLGDSICRNCARNPQRNLFTAENGMDLGEVPQELTGLSMIEEILIARVHPVVSVFKIRGMQTGYSGNTMNFVQHVERFATRLPHDISTLTAVLLINRMTPHGLVQFRVRSETVRRALVWLKTHNQYYHDIIIDEDSLASLPSDGDVVHLLPTLSINENIENVPEEEPDNNIESSGFPNLPIIDSSAAIQRDLQRVVDNTSESDLLQQSWPDISQAPLNEFSTEGLICKAFPTLFPYGRGDLHQPRLEKISSHKYFQYLLDYHDGRFAKNERFPYYAYNSVARWDALNCGNVYIRFHELENLNVDELRQIANDQDSDVAGNIMYYGATLRGTRAFWKQRSSELTQMVLQLGTPTIFFTLSAADYHWPDLFRLLSPEIDSSLLTERQRSTLMHENPFITAKYFNERCLLFMSKFMTKVFPIKDFWYRFEWQHRGSPHIHGLLWFDGAPDCDNINSLDDDAKSEIVAYFDNFVSATIGRQYMVPTRENPCRKRFTDLTDAEKSSDLDRILSAVQTHTRCGRHCMRKKRGSRVEECRFGFPINEEEESCLRLENGTWKFIPKRNNTLLQRHNKFVTQVWRGNTDFSAITSRDAVLKYISKYASKGETSSTAYSEVLKRLMNSHSDDSAASTVVRRLLMSSVAERNYSAQEVSHLLMGWPLFHASRTFVILSISDRWQRYNNRSISLVQRYAIREGYDDISLFRFVECYKVVNGHTIARGKSVIVRVIPYLKPSDDPDENAEYHKLYCKLHIPWRDRVEELLTPGLTWTDLYLNNFEQLQPPGAEFPEPEEVVYEDDIYDHTQIVRDVGMAASRLQPNAPQNDPLGQRPIDEACEWPTLTTFGFTESIFRDYFKTLKESPIQSVSRGPTIAENSLSPEQREVISVCKSQIQNPDNCVKRVLVQGRAGTGKSALIKIMCELLELSSAEGCCNYQVLAPTGAAALNVDGKTIHSYLHIPVSTALTPLIGETLRLFQLKMSTVKFLIIDEYSMVGLRLLGKIHRRLMEARPGIDEPFGGINIYLFGDIRQLPPVLDVAIYMQPRDDLAVQASSLINSFDKKIQLSVCHRQTPDQIVFKQMLDNLSRGQVNQEDWNLLMTRRISINPTNSFKDAIYLFPTNNLVRDHNTSILSSNRLPVALIEAEHNNSTARQGKDALAQGLSSSLHLSIGCRVMLRKNIDVSRGLVNGSLGILRQIIYHPDKAPPSLPAVLLIEFERFNGPFIRDRCYPLYPSTVTWRDRDIECTRKQFAINLAYALTIHKSQGLTLDKAIIDIGPKEMSPGSSYVALSRVRRLDDMLILRGYDYNRLSKLGDNIHIRNRERFLHHINASDA